MGETLRIVIADDHAIYRTNVAQIIEDEGDMHVIGQGASAAEAVDLAMQMQPDILLLDLNMPGGGLSAISPVRARAPRTCVVVLSGSPYMEDLEEALEEGAHRCLTKGISASELVTALRMAARQFSPLLERAFP